MLRCDIVYRKGFDNAAPDTFSQIHCASLNSKSLKSLPNHYAIKE